MADKIRLRRGASTNRINELPDPGEPLFDMDTRKLYIGDGVTPGGQPVAGGSQTSFISELLDVDTNGIQDGEVLVWDQTQQTFVAGTSAGGVSSYNDLTDKPTIPDILDDLGDVNTFGASDGQVLTYRAGTNDWVPLDTNISNVGRFFRYMVADDSSSVVADLYEDTIDFEGGNHIQTSADNGTKTLTISYTGPDSITGLTDTIINTATTGQVLRFNGTNWVNVALAYSDLTGTPSVPSSSSDLDDINVNLPTGGQVLRWDGTNFVNATLSFSDLSGAPVVPSELSDLSDASVTGPVGGEVLRYNGTNFVNAQLSYNDLSNTPTIPTNISDLNNDAGYSTADTLVELTDTSIGTPLSGQVLRHDGVDWKNTNLSYNDLNDTPTLGTAAFANTADFATAAQGAKADSALQDITGESILDLADVPNIWGSAGQVLAVNGSADGFVFTTVSTGGGTQNLWATITGDSGSTTADSTSDNLSIVGGDGINTSISGDTVTITSSTQQRYTQGVIASSNAVFETFAATNEAAWIDYVFKTTGGAIKMGTLFIATDATTASVADSGSAVGATDIGFIANVNAGNVEVSYVESNGDSGNLAWTLKILSV